MMGVYLALDDTQTPLASSMGWADVCHWIDGLDAGEFGALAHLREYGWVEPAESLLAELRSAVEFHPPDDPTVSDTLAGFVAALEGGDESAPVVVTDGLGPDDGSDDAGDMGGQDFADRSNLVPKQITNVNGVKTRVWVKPDEAGGGIAAPGEAKVKLSPKQAEAARILDASLSASGVSEYDKKEFAEASRRVVSRMGRSAAERFARNTKEVEWFPGADSLTDAIAKTDPEFAAEMGTEYVVPGCWGDGKLWLSADPGGRGRTMHDVFAHEFAHAVDGAGYELSRSRPWVFAWDSEIRRRGGLTNYAKTDPHEGFAELCRLFWAHDADAGAIKKKFPRCVEFLESRGLV